MHFMYNIKAFNTLNNDSKAFIKFLAKIIKDNKIKYKLLSKHCFGMFNSNN